MSKKTPKSLKKTVDVPSTSTPKSDGVDSDELPPGNSSISGEVQTLEPIGGQCPWRFITKSTLFKQMADDGSMDEKIVFFEKKEIPYGILEIGGKKVTILYLPTVQFDPPELLPQTLSAQDKDGEKIKEKRGKGRGRNLFKQEKSEAKGTLEKEENAVEVTKPVVPRNPRKRASTDFTIGPSPKRVTRSQTVQIQHPEEQTVPAQSVQENAKDEKMELQIAAEIHHEDLKVNGTEENKNMDIDVVTLEGDIKENNGHGHEKEEKEKEDKEKETKREQLKNEKKFKKNEEDEEKKNGKNEDKKKELEDKKKQKGHKKDKNKTNTKEEDEKEEKKGQLEDEEKDKKNGEDETKDDEEEEDEEDNPNDSDEEDSLEAMKQIMALANSSDDPAGTMLQWLRTLGPQGL